MKLCKNLSRQGAEKLKVEWACPKWPKRSIISAIVSLQRDVNSVCMKARGLLFLLQFIAIYYVSMPKGWILQYYTLLFVIAFVQLPCQKNAILNITKVYFPDAEHH